jgi:uncharacterized membrane protein YczE
MKRRLIRFAIYFVGMMLLATGLVLNTRTTLGVSPIISVANAVSEMSGMRFGDATFIWYALFVITEMILHCLQGGSALRENLIKDALQLPLSLVFTRFLNVLGVWIPVFESDCAGTFAGSFAGRCLFLALAIVLTGIGAALSLDMRIIPNPGDGIVQTIADFIGRKTGTVKNFFDLGCVILTCIVSVACGGRIIGIGIGTVAAVIGVGRVIALVNRLFLGGMQKYLLSV